MAKSKREPKTFAEQLGIKEGDLIICLHGREQFITRLRSQLPPYARLFPTIPEDKAPNAVIRFFNEHADFDSTFRWLDKRLAPGGCVWGVIMKKSALRQGQRDLRDDMVRAAKRTAFTEARTVIFSPTEIGIKFSAKKTKA